VVEETLFIYSVGNHGGIYLRWWSLPFFPPYFWKDKDEGLSRNNHGRTEGTDPGTCIDVWSGRTSGGQGCSQLFFYWPVPTERGQTEGNTVQGILGEGTNTWSTGYFVCDIIWRLQQPPWWKVKSCSPWRRTGGHWWIRGGIRNNILFKRTMLMSLIGWISSTGTWHPPPPWILVILCGVNLRNKLLLLEICRLGCVGTVNIHDASCARVLRPPPHPPDPPEPSKGGVPRGGESRNYLKWRFDTEELFRVVVKSRNPNYVLTVTLTIVWTYRNPDYFVI